MKKLLPYLLISVMIIAIIVLLVTGKSGNRHVFDERITFRKTDRIPYGTFVAYENLKNIFPNASVMASREEPGRWDSISVYDEDQALVIICQDLNADTYEMNNLIRFADNGNDVFISAMDISYDAAKLLRCEVRSGQDITYFFNEMPGLDSLTLNLASPPYPEQSLFRYPGKKFDGYFSEIDSTISTILGYNVDGRPDFVQFRTGKGNLYLHLAPMAFTNYFLLHKKNFPYYEHAFSLLSPHTSKLVWDEYFLYKRESRKNNDEERGWLGTLLNVRNSEGKKSFATGFWILILFLFLYVLLEMRRKRKFVPVIKKPKNDSLDFVKTIGRLYHDKGDHKNLCQKMSAYFLEHVRNRYKLPTTLLDEEFVRSLSAKSGVDETEIKSIVSFIKQVDQAGLVTEAQLIAFHSQLESFYKKE